MILLDTNVISALMLREPDRAVVRWLDGQPPESIWTTSVTVFEIQFGLEILPLGRRRRDIEKRFTGFLEDEFEGRIVALDETGAYAAATLAGQRRRSGRTIEIRDALIAGIAIARKATIATRNVRHFEDLGVDLIDPWSNALPRTRV